MINKRELVEDLRAVLAAHHVSKITVQGSTLATMENGTLHIGLPVTIEELDDFTIRRQRRC